MRIMAFFALLLMLPSALKAVFLARRNLSALLGNYVCFFAVAYAGLLVVAAPLGGLFGIFLAVWYTLRVIQPKAPPRFAQPRHPNPEGVVIEAEFRRDPA